MKHVIFLCGLFWLCATASGQYYTNDLSSAYDGYTSTGYQLSTQGQEYAFPPFTPAINYSRPWLYSTTTLGIDSELCYGVETITNGTIGGYWEAGYLNLWGSAKVFPNQTTYLEGYQEVFIGPSFQITLTTGGSVYIHIIPCPDSGMALSAAKPPASRTIHNLDATPSMTTDQQQTPKTPNSLKVYPTVSTGLVYIKGDASELANMNVQVFDEAGRNLYQTRSTGNTLITADLSGFRNGIYFLHMTNGSGTTVKKVVINK